jgi:hypothetical protein
MHVLVEVGADICLLEHLPPCSMEPLLTLLTALESSTSLWNTHCLDLNGTECVLSHAGEINLTAAILSLKEPVTLSPSALLLPTGKATIKTSIKVTNGGTKAKSYKLSHIFTYSIATNDTMPLQFNPDSGRYEKAPFVPDARPDGLKVRGWHFRNQGQEDPPALICC